MVQQLQNPTKSKRFDGKIYFDGSNGAYERDAFKQVPCYSSSLTEAEGCRGTAVPRFEYEIFITPLVENTPDFEYVVEHIRRRRRKNERRACLGTTKSVITRHLKQKMTSAYGFVREIGSNDEASGSLQVYDWYNHTPETAQVWVNDLCRHTQNENTKSSVSPVKVLLFLFEQLAAHQWRKSEIYLKVERVNEPILVPVYEKYGFERETKLLKNMDLIPMKKTIEPDSQYANFPFFLTKSTTRKRKRSSIQSSRKIRFRS
jgi:hypothetical protein